MFDREKSEFTRTNGAAGRLVGGSIEKRGGLLWWGSAFHVRERRREAHGWKAYVSFTALQTFGCIAISRYSS